MGRHIVCVTRVWSCRLENPLVITPAALLLTFTIGRDPPGSPTLNSPAPTARTLPSRRSAVTLTRRAHPRPAGPLITSGSQINSSRTPGSAHRRPGEPHDSQAATASRAGTWALAQQSAPPPWMNRAAAWPPPRGPCDACLLPPPASMQEGEGTRTHTPATARAARRAAAATPRAHTPAGAAGATGQQARRAARAPQTWLSLAHRWHPSTSAPRARVPALGAPRGRRAPRRARPPCRSKHLARSDAAPWIRRRLDHLDGHTQKGLGGTAFDTGRAFHTLG
jgi:hypothetical protein